MSRTRVIRYLLEYAAWLVAAAAVVWVLAQLGALSQSSEATVSQWLTAVGWLIAGLASAALLGGLSELLRLFESLRDARERSGEQRAFNSSSASSRGESAGLPTHTVDELVVLLREVRDISLLDSDQRRMRLDVQGRAILEMLQREVPTLLREHNWIEARHRVQDARQRFPMIKQLDEMEQQIELQRAQVEAADVEQAQRQIEDLTALGAWDRAVEVAGELLKRHPDSPRCIDLAQRLRAQRHSAEAEQRAKLMAQAQESTNRRDWKAALALANTLVQRFPKSAEAAAVRLQLPTLRENAEIQTRQTLEQQYRDLCKEHRFGDALRIAKELLDQYPNSPQAEVLRDQIPKLRDAAAALAR